MTAEPPTPGDLHATNRHWARIRRIFEAMDDMKPKYITRQQAAKRYGLCLRYVSILIEQGVLPSVKLGRRCVRLPVEKCDAAIEALETGGKRKTA